MAGSFMKGALVELTPTLLVPVPNVIVFQLNPETLRHSFSQPQRDGHELAGNPLAVAGLPGESFSFTLFMDSNDAISEGSPSVLASGIYPRLAALEMLMYPTGGGGAAGLLGSVEASASLSVSPAGIGVSASVSSGVDAKRAVPASHVPVVLFIWGPRRIVPVRITGLTITEKLYDASLTPTAAEAQIELRVVTPDEFGAATDALTRAAKAAYAYSQRVRQAHALENVAGSVESIIGMLPT